MDFRGNPSICKCCSNNFHASLNLCSSIAFSISIHNLAGSRAWTKIVPARVEKEWLWWLNPPWIPTTTVGPFRLVKEDSRNSLTGLLLQETSIRHLETRVVSCPLSESKENKTLGDNTTTWRFNFLVDSIPFLYMLFFTIKKNLN